MRRGASSSSRRGRPSCSAGVGIRRTSRSVMRLIAPSVGRQWTARRASALPPEAELPQATDRSGGSRAPPELLRALGARAGRSLAPDVAAAAARKARPALRALEPRPGLALERRLDELLGDRLGVGTRDAYARSPPHRALLVVGLLSSGRRSPRQPGEVPHDACARVIEAGAGRTQPECDGRCRAGSGGEHCDGVILPPVSWACEPH